MGLFDLFKRGSNGRQANADTSKSPLGDTDWTSMTPRAGLPRMVGALALNEDTWGFKDNVDSKLELLRDLMRQVDAEDDNFQAILIDPDANPRSVQSYKELSDFGKATVMLLFGVGNFALFLGTQRDTAVKNSVAGEAAELRSLMLVCKAYEVWGDSGLIAACVEPFMPQFSQRIDALPGDEVYAGDERQAYADAALMLRHVCDLFYDHYRPRRMPNMSMVDAQPKTILDLRAVSARALRRS